MITLVRQYQNKKFRAFRQTQQRRLASYRPEADLPLLDQFHAHIIAARQTSRWCFPRRR